VPSSSLACAIWARQPTGNTNDEGPAVDDSRRFNGSVRLFSLCDCNDRATSRKRARCEAPSERGRRLGGMTKN
jgi:hypothetical protein